MPLGLLRYTCLPQGFTNSVAEFQNCMTSILQDKIPHIVGIMIDDIGIKGPKTQYKDEEGKYETIPENPSIRHFIWEHANDINRILHQLAHAGAMISPKKSQVARPKITLVGQKLTYDGRLPDTSHILKILKWPIPCNKTEVHRFLGLCGTVQIWIKDYSLIAQPLCWNTSGKAVLQGGSVPDIITFFSLFLLSFSYPPKGTWVCVVTDAPLSCLTPKKECN